MNTLIEIHDSSVVGIDQSNGAVVVHFKYAYLHKSEGRPGIDAGTGWEQEAKLIFSRAIVSGDFPDWPCDLMDGEISIDGELHDNFIPIPLETSGAIELRLVCDAIHIVTITSREVQLVLIGEPKFIEEFKPRSSSV